MQLVLRNLMAFVLLIHALLGCCSHHAHAAAEPTKAKPNQLVAPVRCCHNHGHSDSENPASDDDRNCQSDCEGDCTFLPPQRTLVDVADAFIVLDLTVPSLAADVVEPASFGNRLSEPIVLPPVVRLHLYYQILLI